MSVVASLVFFSLFFFSSVHRIRNKNVTQLATLEARRTHTKMYIPYKFTCTNCYYSIISVLSVTCVEASKSAHFTNSTTTEKNYDQTCRFRAKTSIVPRT